MSEAEVLCAFVTGTNINSIRSEWRCDNTDNKCSWSGITCQDGNVTEINLNQLGISGKYKEILILF
jgi:hypothetical protein